MRKGGKKGGREGEKGATLYLEHSEKERMIWEHVIHTNSLEICTGRRCMNVQLCKCREWEGEVRRFNFQPCHIGRQWTERQIELV